MSNQIFSRKYLLVLFLSVPITLAFFVIIYFSYNSIGSRNKLKQNIAHFSSHNVLDKIDRNFYERFGDVQAFAYNRLAVQAIQNDSINPELQKFINTMTSYYVLYDLMMLCDKNGKVIAVNTVDKAGQQLNTISLIGKSVANTEWFTTCMSAKGPEGGAWYSDFVADQDVKTINNDNTFGWGMAFAAPVKDDNGVAIGAWYNFASWKEVTIKIRQQAENELRAGNEGAILIITNKDGKIIDAKDSTLVLNGTTLKAENMQKDEAMTFGNMTILPSDYEYDWADAYGSYTYKGKEWKALVMMPKEKFTLGTLFSGSLTVLYLVVFLFLSGAAYLALQFSKRVTSSLKGLKLVVDNISRGELTESKIDSQDEIGEMAKAVNTLVASLSDKVHFAENIGAGRLQSDYQPVSDKDILGISLVNMRNSLAQASEADQKRNWVTEGLAKFASLMRTSENTYQLFDNVLSNLVHYMDANQGALFVLEEGTEALKQLEMVACYAYDRKKFLYRKFDVGEGLAGQAVLEKEYIYLTSVPEAYINISSGLGNARPRCVLVMPLIVNEEVLGVVELAFFTEIPKHYIEFLQKISENIASVISSTKINELTKKLLENAQEMTESMRAQEEEMRQNMEELQATQEEMNRKTNDLEIKYEKERFVYEAEIEKYKTLAIELELK